MKPEIVLRIGVSQRLIRTDFPASVECVQGLIELDSSGAESEIDVIQVAIHFWGRLEDDVNL